MKVKFTSTEYTLITRELQDARLCLTFMKGAKTCEEIEEEIRQSVAIRILSDDSEIAVYEGFTDVMVIKDFETGAVSVELINNFLLQRTMELSGRVADLEDSTSELSAKTGSLETTASDLGQETSELNLSQNNQDAIIEYILKTI